MKSLFILLLSALSLFAGEIEEKQALIDSLKMEIAYNVLLSEYDLTAQTKVLVDQVRLDNATRQIVQLIQYDMETPSFASKIFGLSFIKDDRIRYAAVTTMYFALGGIVTTTGIIGAVNGW